MKFTLEEAMKAPEGEFRYSSVLSLTSALDMVGGQRHAPVAVLPGKRPVTLSTGVRVGPQGRSVRVWKISPPPGFDPQTVTNIRTLKTRNK